MTDHEDFLHWVNTTLYEAERAIHNGDQGPRRAIWSRNEPVSVLGAVRNAVGQPEIDELFSALERKFSDCTSYAIELQACDVVGDMAARTLGSGPPIWRVRCTSWGFATLRTSCTAQSRSVRFVSAADRP